MQLDFDGNKEKVDTAIFQVQIICTEPGCFQTRYVKSQDRHETKLCKPHSRLNRLKTRALAARLRRKKRRDAQYKKEY